MTDRPILFSGPMVRALWDDRKTQTRRTLKFQPAPGISIIRKTIRPIDADPYHSFERRSVYGNYAGELDIKIKRGDRLWVRETWAPLTYLTHNDPGPQAIIDGGFYRADGGTVDGEVSRWKPSIFMPRHASRMTLIVTDVRVERLQDINREDAIAEGLIRVPLAPQIAAELGCDWGFDGDSRHGAPVSAYAALWDHINGAGAWEANPWVAAYTFRVIKQNIDEVGN